MMNHIDIQGRLVRDAELRRTQDGTSVCTVTLACERDFQNRNGERETDFIDVVFWKNTADFVSSYFRKGSMMVVSGRLQIRKWEDKDGNKRSTAEIQSDHVYFGEQKKADSSTFTVLDDDDDDLPFN